MNKEYGYLNCNYKTKDGKILMDANTFFILKESLIFKNPNTNEKQIMKDLDKYKKEDLKNLKTIKITDLDEYFKNIDKIHNDNLLNNNKVLATIYKCTKEIYG